MERLKFTWILFIFLNFLKISFSQLQNLNIGETLHESIEKIRFYRVELTNKTAEYLIVNVKPSDNYEKYSDPDIYVSQINSYPSDFEFAEWYSLNIGEDMIPIPNKALENSTYISIGIKCVDKCEYDLSVYYEDKIELFTNDFYMMKFGQNETTKIFHYNHNSTEMKKFEIFALSVGYQNTIEVKTQEAWFNGLSALVNMDNYFNCEKCFFRIEITTQVNSFVLLGINLKNSVKKLQYLQIGIGTLESGDRDCYNISLTFDTPIDKNEPFILTLHSFLEDANVYLTKSLEDQNGDKSFMVKNDFVTKLNYQDLKDHLVCIKPMTEDNTSYILKVIQEKHIETYQRYNFLVNGMSLYGYLPGNNATSYRHWVFDVTSTKLNINLKVVSGNPVLYAYICTDYFNCQFTGEKIKIWSKSGSLYSSSRVNDYYHISIPNEKNTCIQTFNQTGLQSMCSTVAIVYCEGDEECQYTVSMNTDNDIVLLTNRVKMAKFVPKNSLDYYKIVNSDPTVQKLTIVLHSHTGDADLFASRTYKYPDEDEDKYVSANVGNRDMLEFYNKNTNNPTSTNNTLLGDFYVAVRGYTYAYYTIYYFTTTDTNLPDYRTLESGFIFSDFVNKNDKIKSYRFINREIEKKTPYIITFNSLNCEGELFYMKPDTDESLFKIDSSYHHNQYLITPDMDFYNNLYGYQFGFKVTNMDSDSIQDEENCLIYVGGVEKTRELVINEAVPHIYTFTKKEDTMSYVYPHAFDQENFVIISIYIEQLAQMKIEYRIGQFNQTLEINKSKSILINKDILKENCNTGLCNVHLTIINSDGNVTYRILAKSSNNKPIYAQKGSIRHDSTTPSVYQYYYTDVAQYESGEISLSTKHGSAVMVGKIVQKGVLPEAGANYNNVLLPKLSTLNNLSYNPTTMSIPFSSDDTTFCYNGCEIYFAVYSKDKYSYNDYLTDYTVLIESKKKPTTLPLDYNIYGKVNSTDDMNFYKLKILEDSDSFSLTADCFAQSCEVYINFGDTPPSIKNSDWILSVSPNEKNKLTINITEYFFKKKINTFKNTIFTIGVASLSTNSFQYNLYASVHKIGNQPIYEVFPGSTQVCEVVNEEDYCDFLVNVDPKYKTLIFYVHVHDIIKVKEHQVAFYANNLNSSDYISAKNSTKLRPRFGKSQETSYGVQGKPLYIYETGMIESIFVLSVQIWKKGVFSLVSTSIRDGEKSTVFPKMAMDYLIFVPPNSSRDIRIGSLSKSYHAKMKRIIGKGKLDYNNNKDTKTHFSIDKNSTTTEIMIQEDNVDLTIHNVDTKYNLVILLRYDENLSFNFDEISLGPSQTIYYPNSRGGFPVSYYLPLINIKMDLTVNLKIKNIIYEDELEFRNSQDEDLTDHLYYDFEALIVDSQSVNDRRTNTKLTFPIIYGYYKGKFDASLATGRVTINANNFNKSQYAVLTLKPGKSPKLPRVVKSFTMQILSFPENSLHHNITLPENIYYYSMINSTVENNASKEDKFKKGHVYKLTRENPYEDYMIIELASCTGEVEYALRDVDPKEEKMIDKNPSLLVNKTRHYHTSYDHFGKKIIEVILTDSSRDLVLVIFPKKFVDDVECDEFTDVCEDDTNVGYAIRYRTFYNKEHFDKFNVGENGLVMRDITNENNLKLYFDSVKYQNGVESSTNYYVRLFYSKFDRSLNKYYSICFAHRTDRVEIFNGVPSINNPVYVNNFPANKDYVVSVLAETRNSDENYGTLLVYTPISVKVNTISSSSDSWIVGKLYLNFLILVLLVIFAFILLLSIYFIYRKYRLTKLQLDYEVNDVRNLASIPKTSKQIAEMNAVFNKEKYANLTDDSV